MREGCEEVVKLLLEQGAQADLENGESDTPLSVAKQGLSAAEQLLFFAKPLSCSVLRQLEESIAEKQKHDQTP